MRFDELIAAYVLGDGSPEERAYVERAIEVSPWALSELRATEDTAAALSGALPPIAPSPTARARLVSAVHELGPLARYTATLSCMFGLPPARCRQILAGLTAPDAWSPGPGPGVEVHRFRGDPTVAPHGAVIVRVQPTVTFPAHVHHGWELGLVLQGDCVELESGRHIGTGEVLWSDRGSRHTLRAGADAALLLAVASGGAIEVR